MADPRRSKGGLRLHGGRAGLGDSPGEAWREVAKGRGRAKDARLGLGVRGEPWEVPEKK